MPDYVIHEALAPFPYPVDVQGTSDGGRVVWLNGPYGRYTSNLDWMARLLREAGIPARPSPILRAVIVGPAREGATM